MKNIKRYKYRVIRKSLRDFRSLRYSSRDSHAEGEQVNRGRDIPSFCLSYLTGARYVQPWRRGRCQSCNQVPATQGKSRGIGGTSRDLPQLRQKIVETVAVIDRQMLQRVWQELDYRIDICRVTKGGHIEHL
jgi:hypothetical protein